MTQFPVRKNGSRLGKMLCVEFVESSGHLRVSGERRTGAGTHRLRDTSSGDEQQQEWDEADSSAAELFHSVEILRSAQDDTRSQKADLVATKMTPDRKHGYWSPRVVPFVSRRSQNKPGKNLGLPAMAAR
jgi:hypothetical protein